MKNYQFYIFDADGTLCDRSTMELLPNVREKLAELNAPFVIATNQGGVGLRYWIESAGGFGETEEEKRKSLDYAETLPTEDDARYNYCELGRELGAADVYISFRYQSKSTGDHSPVPRGREADVEWSSGWRKPNPGMLEDACSDLGVSPSVVLFVGDSPEDEKAAQNAGVDFMHADEFFGREK